MYELGKLGTNTLENPTDKKNIMTLLYFFLNMAT